MREVARRRRLRRWYLAAIVSRNSRSGFKASEFIGRRLSRPTGFSFTDNAAVGSRRGGQDPIGARHAW